MLPRIPREPHLKNEKAPKTYINISWYFYTLLKTSHRLPFLGFNFAYVVVNFVKTGVDSLNRQKWDSFLFFCFLKSMILHQKAPLTFKPFNAFTKTKKAPISTWDKDTDSDGDPYGIRTRECMRERHVS